MRGVAWGLLGLTLLAALGGCARSLTQEDMKRRAIRRSAEDEEEEESRPAVAAEPAAESVASGDGPQPAQSTRATQPPASTQTPTDRGTANVSPSPADTSAAAAGSPASPDAAGSLPPSTTRQPPETPLTPVERARLTRENLARIGEALAEYSSAQRRLPPQATHSAGTRSPLLSWRVELLPYLGLRELYEAFRLDQPWDSPHNRRLLPLIPAVYQSPERFDDQTNYLGCSGSTCAFRGHYGLGLNKIEDGPAETAAVVEVNDDRAVPWTRPVEFEVLPNQPGIGLGTLREGGFYAVSAAGTVHWVGLPIDPDRLRAMFTADAGESFGLTSLASADPASEAAAGLAPGPTATPDSGDLAGRPADGSTPDPASSTPDAAGRATTTAPPAAATNTPGTAARAASPATSGNPGQPLIERLPVPNPLAQRNAKNLFREVYGDEYAQATQPADKKELARKLMDHVPEVRPDPASHYVLLDIIREIAVQGDDPELAIEALDELCQTYDADRHDLRRKTLASCLKKDQDGRIRSSQSLMQHALRYAQDARSDEAYQEAEELCSLAIAAIQGDRNNKEQIDQIARYRDEVRDFKQARVNADEALRTLEKSPTDGVARLALGRYLCFYRDDWENGLSILAEASSGGLHGVAQLELQQPATPEAQAALGDAWWDRAESAGPAEQLAMRRRAAMWYAKALPTMPAGLQKVKIQRRQDDFAQDETHRLKLLSGKP